MSKKNPKCVVCTKDGRIILFDSDNWSFQNIKNLFTIDAEKKHLDWERDRLTMSFYREDKNGKIKIKEDISKLSFDEFLSSIKKWGWK